MQHFKHYIWISLIVLAVTASLAHAVTDTVYIQKRITDTLYVASPPDTVYIQKSTISEKNADNSDITPNKFIQEYSTDTLPTGRKFYIGIETSLSIISIWFGAPIINLSYEIENTYRGSLLFTFSSIMLFGEFNLRDEEPTWEGYRSIISPGIGYRQYLITNSIFNTNLKKHNIKFRNTPRNSLSFYIQALASPTFKIAYDKQYKSESPKKGSFDAGISLSATLGSLWNLGNMLWDMGFTLGYQYWSDDARKYLSYKHNKDEINYRIISGLSSKGLFFGTECKLGF